MKVALIAEPGWLEREFETHRHLVVGLMNDGVQVVRIAPEGAFEDKAAALAGERIVYAKSSWLWLQDHRIKRLHDILDEIEVDMVHALSGAVVGAAVGLGRTMDIPVICSVWSMKWAGPVRRALRERGGIITVPAEGMIESLRESPDDESVHLVKPGVFVSDDVPGALENRDASICCLVIGDGRTDGSFAPLLQALAELRDEIPQLMFFLCVLGGDVHRLWQLAKELALLDRVNIVDPGPGGNELMIQADVVIQPQASGEFRGIILEAMAAGRPVIAAPDPALDYLIDDETARLIDSADQQAWVRILRDLRDGAPTWQALGQRAQAYVKQTYSPTKYIEGMLNVYRMAASRPIAYLPRVRAEK